MDLKFNVSMRVSRPVDEVFEAVANPDHLSQFFTTGGASERLRTGTTVMWKFHEFPDTFAVEVVEVVPNKKIVLRWEAYEVSAAGDEAGEGANYLTTVTMTFKPLEGNRTLVAITEHGWRQTQAGLNGSYGNCMGWTQMLCALKAWMEYGVNLREGAFK